MCDMRYINYLSETVSQDWEKAHFEFDEGEYLMDTIPAKHQTGII